MSMHTNVLAIAILLASLPSFMAKAQGRDVCMRYAGKWIAAIFCFTYALSAAAQVTVDDNFNQLIKPRTEISTLGPDLFGDKVALYTGTTEFEVTDVSVPGNNTLPVAVGRRFVVEDRTKSVGAYAGQFGDWDLDIPHLHGVFAAAAGWQVSTAGSPNARCSVPAQFATSNGVINATPPNVNGTNNFPFSSAEYWSGNHLYIPGQGDKTMMVVAPGNGNLPGDGKSHPWVTADNWTFSCLPATANGTPGEAFVAISPTGVQYIFDWFVSRSFKQLQKPSSICAVPGPSCYSILDRVEIWVLPTSVRDRFGNTVTYTYDPANPWRLTGIRSGDQRSITLSYNSSGRVSTVTTGGQSWSYGYDSNGGLATVTLPDGSAWHLDYSRAGNQLASGTAMHTACADAPNYYGNNGVAVATHPSGATGTFVFSAHQHGRSYVPRKCVYTIGGGSYAGESDTINVISIDSKSIAGAGFGSALTWTYAYGPQNRSYVDECSGSSCPTIKTVTVTNPDSTWSRHTFSNRYNTAEGRLLLLETGAGSSVMRTETTNYQLNAAGQSYPSIVGKSPCYRCDQEGWQPLPISSAVISQDGVTYTTAVNAFDVFARPTSKTKSSSIGYSKSDTIEYADNLNSWVLGQVKRTTTNGNEVSRADFDSVSALPTARYSFGLLVNQYGYAGDGTLSSVTDGRSYTTKLSNWKRGIPQSVSYPDSKTTTLLVDDLGRITSLTDRSGYTTRYAYDGVGRVTRIDYPAGNEVAWYPSLYRYDFVTSAERGITGSHWRRTVAKGNAVAVTYYDAWLRPILTDTYASTDGSSHSTLRKDFDWNGNIVFQAYPVSGSPDLGSVTKGVRTSLDALQRVTQVNQDSEKGTLSTTTTYSQGALATVRTDPRNGVTKTHFQAFEEPAYEAAVLIQSLEGVTQTISRDAFGSVTSIKQSGVYGTGTVSVTKNFYYDANHKLCRVFAPESGSNVMAYDPAGNISWTAVGQPIGTSDCGQSAVAEAAKTYYQYDPVNRMTAEKPPANTQSSLFTYYPTGELQTATSGISTWSGTRNKMGQLTAETFGVSGNGSNTIRYTHDAYGSIKTITYPDSVSIDYAPDPLGRPTKAGAYASGATYYPDGSLQHFTYGNGTDYLAQQNQRLLLSNVTYAKGATINFSEDFGYDANGNLTSVNDLAGGLRSKTLTYDGLDRLRSATAAGLWGTEGYSYDPLNNLRSRTTQGQTLTYNYDTRNRLSTISQGSSTTVSLLHDDRGNVSSRNGAALTFDQKNQLLNIAGYDSYSYDASGRRVLRAPANGSPGTFYFYSQAGQLLYQYEAATTKTTDYIYLGKKLVARSESYASMIRGNIDAVPIDGQGNASITGWACSYGSTQSLNVDLYLGGASGTYVSRTAATRASEPAVASACGVGSGNFRFSIPLSASVRSQYAGQGIYVHGISTAGTDRFLILNAGKFQVPALPSAPPSPGSISAAAAGDLSSISVSWAASSGATSYRLQQRFNAHPYSGVYSGAATSFAVNSPADGTYTFQVQACNLGGCSAPTTSNSAVIAHIPSAPSAINAPGTSNGPITVGWSSSAYATSYTLEQSVNGAAWGAIYSGAATSFAFSVGTTANYAYRVKACNANGCGGYATSGRVVVTIPPSSAPVVSAPGTTSTSSYTVAWSGVSGATSYDLQERVNGSGWSTVQSANALSWGASGKLHNTTYGYIARACNAGGCGPWSATASVYVWLIPGTPSAPVLTNTTQGGRIATITSSWPAVPNATYYQVEVTAPGEGVRPLVNVSTNSYGWNAHYSGIGKERVTACTSSGCSAWSGYGSVSISLRP